MNELKPTPVVTKTAASFLSTTQDNPNAVKIDIDFSAKSFSIAFDNIQPNSGIAISVGGCKDLQSLKSIVNSLNNAIDIIEKELLEE